MLYQDVESELLVTKEKIAERVRELGRQIARDYEGRDLVVVSILKGSVLFFSDLIREIDMPLTIDFMQASSYGNAAQSSGFVHIKKDLDRDIEGKDVLLVEDIVDSGRTLAYLKTMLKERGANSIRVATLLDKPEGRQVEMEADYVGFIIPNAFVVGYGLDYAEKYRNIPEIGILRPRVYQG
ncbi:MAG: hypoxanthine phosphoribosyltransferase [Clostridia bacterium]|nr:hypoxanthine phosphoribosyltransferase [Clostridia bacterium]